MPMDEGGWTRIGDPDALGAAGQAAAQRAGEARAAGRLPEESSERAFREFRGESWDGELGDALAGALRKWAEQTSTLVGSCRSFAGKCTETAENFRGTEQTNTTVLRATRPTDSPFG